MLLPRGLGRPGLEPLQRYGSWPAYYALLSLSLVPFLTFFVASLAALAQLLRHRASYLWPLVLGGQLVACGALYGQALQPHLRPLVRGRADHAFASVVDVGASLLAHAGFATLCRLAWCVVPAGRSSSSSSSSLEAARLLREWRVGCALLVPHALSGAAVLLLWWPAAAACTPFAQLPFCAYFAAVAFDYRRLAREWAAKEGEEGEGLGAGRPRECGRLFDAMVVVAGAMTVRSVLGIVAVAFGIYESSFVYAPLVWTIITDDVALFVCFRAFWNAHPGLHLPPQLLTVRFDKSAKGSYVPVELE